MRKVFPLLLVSLLYAEDKVDLSVVNRIKLEEFQNSKVMDHAFYLTDVYGPRLTGSPGYKAAAEWAVREMQKWGLSNARLEKWGPFGRGWANMKFSAALKEPTYTPLIGSPRPWSPGTNGVVSGEPVIAQICNDVDMEKFKGKLKGKIVLLQQAVPVQLEAEAPLKRYSDPELAAQAASPDPSLRPFSSAPVPGDSSSRARTGPCPATNRAGGDRASGQPFDSEAARRERDQQRNKINKFLTDEGAVLTLVPSYRTDGGTVFASAAGSRDAKDPLPPPSVALTSEHYDRIARLIQKKMPVTLEFDIQNRFYDEEKDSFNVTAELPGGAKKDEIVMLGGHLDSWSFGQGATDNAAGCAVMMEVMRLLKTLELKTARTVRIGLWSGEEQGLLGSRAYVTQHFADRETMKLQPEHAKVAAYFNLDNGSGKIRGVYLQGNDMVRPIFEAWLAPFKDLGAGTLTIRNTGGTDHLSFDAVGLPGFQFIQDPLEYNTRTHHSNMDVYDRLQAGDLMQASAIIASFAWHAANRDQMLPRKPLPKPSPRGTGGGEGRRRSGSTD
jgi:carboxypeptidase Q